MRLLAGGPLDEQPGRPACSWTPSSWPATRSTGWSRSCRRGPPGPGARPGCPPGRWHPACSSGRSRCRRRRHIIAMPLPRSRGAVRVLVGGPRRRAGALGPGRPTASGTRSPPASPSRPAACRPRSCSPWRPHVTVLGHEPGVDRRPGLRAAERDPVAVLGAVGEVDGELMKLSKVSAGLMPRCVEEGLVVADDVVLEAPRDGPLAAAAQRAARLEVPARSRCAGLRRCPRSRSPAFVADEFCIQG